MAKRTAKIDGNTLVVKTDRTFCWFSSFGVSVSLK